jgi:hypothetical protein
MARQSDKPASNSGPDLAVVWRRIEALRPDPANPRSHSPKQIRQLARSIGAFGFNVPILLDRSLRIIAGHGRLLAAQELGWREVPTILLDHLSDARAHAFMIADNRLAENASWNDRLLAQQLKELSLAELDFGIEATGFELSEIDLRTGAARRPSPLGKRKPRPSADKIPRQVLPSVARDGDWWLLGNHRVGCGNLADAAAEMLSGEDSVVVVLAADPAAADAVIRRWQALSGSNARHAATGRCFEPPADTMQNSDAD